MTESPFRDPLEILRELRTATRETFAALVQEFGFSILPFDHIPAEAFEELLATLRSSELAANLDAWKLIHILMPNWHMVSAEQQAALRPVLIEAFVRFPDPTGSMVIAELLGKNYCDVEALTQLTHLSIHAPMPARALTPHGLKSFAQSTTNPGLRLQAVARLKVLTKDPEPEVRQEAAVALSNCG